MKNTAAIWVDAPESAENATSFEDMKAYDIVFQPIEMKVVGHSGNLRIADVGTIPVSEVV